MSQHNTFEEAFHDGPQPEPSYQDGYPGPQPVRYTGNVPGQKLQTPVTPDLQRGNDSDVGARLVLATISLVMVFLMFLYVMDISGDNSLVNRGIFFSLVFTGVAVIINIVFNRRH